MTSLWQPGELSRGCLETPGITHWKLGLKAAVYSPACSSLEEVGAGSGMTRVVSETAQMFWGKLEWPGRCERRLHQNLKKFTWDGPYLPECLMQNQRGQLCVHEPTVPDDAPHPVGRGSDSLDVRVLTHV